MSLARSRISDTREVAREIEVAIGGCWRRVLSDDSALLNAFRQSTFSASEHAQQPLQYVGDLTHLTRDQPALGRTGRFYGHTSRRFNHASDTCAECAW